METKKIGLACFIGGVICAIALLIAPAYWYFGLVIGFASGYLSYEFMDVQVAIPKAWRFAVIGPDKVNQTWRDIRRKTIADVRTWVSEPHPFIYLALPPALGCVAWLIDFIGQQSPVITRLEDAVVYSIFVLAMVSIGLFQITGLICLLLCILAFIGARAGEKSFWWPSLVEMPESEADETFDKLIARGYNPASITYWNVYRWILKGAFISIEFFVWTVPKFCLLGLGMSIKIMARFVFKMIKLIHSDKRLLCGVDGTFGGSVVYLFLAKPDATIAERVVIVVAGGVMGAVLGILNWEIVSKRILRIAPATS